MPRFNRGPGLLAIAAFLLLTVGCDRPSPPVDMFKTDLPVKTIDGEEIPHFRTAAGQLNYSRSGFDTAKRKRAALRAVSTLFPKDRLECGHADIGLAYLCLEPDYRFAGPDKVEAAAKALADILRAYTDVRDVMAKAHWTLGWIYTDLKGMPDRGIPHYWQVVRSYPDVPMNLRPPVPWVNLVSPPHSQPSHAGPGLARKFWAEVALLEIIRNTDETGRAVLAFDILFQNYAAGPAAGFALKAMLEKPELAAHARPEVPAYLVRSGDNPYLAKEIRRLARGKTP